MNRPFYAFGALAGALALTMLAVSSTSRSTTVRRPVPSSQASAQAEAPKSARLGNIYVVVLPAGDDLAGDPAPDGDATWIVANEAPLQPSYATGCGLDRLTGRVYTGTTGDRAGWEFGGCGHAWSPCEPTDAVPGGCDLATSEPISTTRVEFAPNDAANSGEFRNYADFYSHHDPVYDRSVYGENLEGSRNYGSTGDGRTSWTSGLQTWLAWLRGKLSQRQVASAVSIFSGIRNRTVTQLENIDWIRPQHSAVPIGWNDYAELVDRALDRGAASGIEAESPTAVRSSRWLLRFAASTLNQASAFFDAVADELNRVAADVQADHLAGEKVSSQR